MVCLLTAPEGQRLHMIYYNKQHKVTQINVQIIEYVGYHLTQKEEQTKNIKGNRIWETGT